jgi:[ribosomal protein S5]-alanine N-acetyltransferase
MMLATDRSALESAMGLTRSDFKLNAPDSFLAELEQVLTTVVAPAVLDHPNTQLWYTHWLIVENSTNLTVGGIGLAGEPNEAGEVMIGYYIDAEVENLGYATEAVGAFSEWIFGLKEVRTIVADTLADGLGSQKVLQKNGFELVGTTEEGLRWVLARAAS